MSRPISHDEVRARLSALIDGALDTRALRTVEAHLDACAGCAAYLAELRSTVTVLRDVEPVVAPDNFAASVRRRLEQSRVPSPRLRPAGLGSRVLAALPRVRPSWRAAAAAAAVVVVGLFAANVLRDRQVGDGARLGRTSGEAPAAPRPPAAASPEAPAAQGSAAADQAARQGTAENVPRYLIRTGRVVVEVLGVDEASGRTQSIAEAAGGFVARSSVAETSGVRRGTFVVRVPARRFEATTRQIEGLGRVRAREYQTEDVGEEYVDVDARLRNLERQEARLLTFMNRASRVSDLVALEGEVSRVRGEIERLAGRRRYLTNRIDLATITVLVTERPKKQPGGFWDIDRTVARAAAAFLGAVRHVLLAAESTVTLGP